MGIHRALWVMSSLALLACIPSTDGNEPKSADADLSSSKDSEACETLSESDCGERDDCFAIFGQSVDADDDESRFVTCSAATSCGGAETCAQRPGGELLRFPSTYHPADWTPVDCRQDGETTDGSHAATNARKCRDLAQAECEARDDCSVLTARVDGSDGEDVPFVACTEQLECGALETCAWDGEDGQTLRFPSTCIPDGWLTTECSGVQHERI